MPRGSERRLRAPLLALACALPLLLAACSSNAGSSSTLSLGLTGSTASHAEQPPTLAANGPADAYAFVYDDQIWIHDAGKPDARQLTHLVLSAGAAIAWGPLVWSPNGQFIAYALNVSDNPAAAARTTGPVYVASTADGSVVNTTATGSLYGHTYAWFGSQMLFYSDGGGIKMYDVGDGDPRVWPVLDPYGDPSGPSGNTYTNGGATYGDIAVTSHYLYYTKITLNGDADLGSVGVVGTAGLKRIFLGDLQPDAGYAPGDIVQLLPLSVYNGVNAFPLGNAYFDKAGSLVAGAWQLSADGTDLIAQQIGDVNAKSGAIGSSFCQGSFNNGFGCGALNGAGTFPMASRPTAGIDRTGAHLAFTAGTLYTQAASGGTVAKVAGLGWTTPPAWSNDGKRVAVTQFVSSSADANGTPRVKLNIVVYDGQNALTLVTGGQDLTWKP
jgi:hypothetical protein